MWRVSVRGPLPSWRFAKFQSQRATAGPRIVPEYFRCVLCILRERPPNTTQVMHPNTTQVNSPIRLRTQLVLAPGQRCRALGRRQRLVHGGAAVWIVIEDDAPARRQRAAPEGGCECGHPGVGYLVVAEVQLLQVGHRPLLEERGQGGHRAVAHLVAGEVELLHLPQAAACVRGPERLAQREHLRVVPPQLGVEERDGRRHLRGKGPAVDLPHEPHIAGVGKLGGAGRDARLERRGKRCGRHRRLARGLAVLAHLPQVLLLARQSLEADERRVVLDEAARVELHYAPSPPLVRLRVGLLARGEVGVDEEHVRLRVAVPQIDRLVRGRQRGGGGRQGVWAAHLQRSLEGGELLWRAVVLGAPPRALRHRHVVEEDAHLAAGSVLIVPSPILALLGLLVEGLQHLRDLAELQPVLVRVVSVEPVRQGGRGGEPRADAPGVTGGSIQEGRVGERPPWVGDDENAHRVAIPLFPLLHLLERNPRTLRQVLTAWEHAPLVGELRQPRRVDQHGVGQRPLERRGVGLARAHLVPVGGLQVQLRPRLRDLLHREHAVAVRVELAHELVDLLLSARRAARCRAAHGGLELVGGQLTVAVGVVQGKGGADILLAGHSAAQPAAQLELVAWAHAERRERGRRAIIERLAAARDQVVAAAGAARLGVQRRLHVGLGPGRAGVEHDRCAVDLDLDLEGGRVGLLLRFRRGGGGDHGGSLAHVCCHRGPQLALRLGFERRGQLAQVGGPRAGLGMQLRRQLGRISRHLERRLHRVERRDDKWEPHRGERQGVEGDCLETLGRGGAGDGDDSARNPARGARVVAEAVGARLGRPHGEVAAPEAVSRRTLFTVRRQWALKRNPRHAPRQERWGDPRGAGELAGTATGYAFVVHGFACLVCCLEAC
eukprot:scaffold35216_cov62-Phaeocystis_antarctica.AAC.1